MAVLGRIDTSTGYSVETRTRNFAQAMHDKWGVGDATYQTGVMAVVAVEDRYMYVKAALHLLFSKQIDHPPSTPWRYFASNPRCIYRYISTGIGAKKYLKDYEIDYIIEATRGPLK